MNSVTVLPSTRGTAGWVLSTTLYKSYVNDLLLELEANSLGVKIGDIYVGCPTCADDIALLACSPDDLQVMLNVAYRYSNQHRYNIHPTKSNIISYTSKSKSKTDLQWIIGENNLQLVDKTVHLGLTRSESKESDTIISERICLARRTLYSLINTGVHGTNGLNPKVSFNIYKTYVLPRLLYSLEVINLSTSNLDSLLDSIMAVSDRSKVFRNEQL